MCATLQIWCLSWNHLMRLSCSKLVRFTQVHSEPKIWYPQWRFHNLFTEKKRGFLCWNEFRYISVVLLSLVRWGWLANNPSDPSCTPCFLPTLSNLPWSPEFPVFSPLYQQPASVWDNFSWLIKALWHSGCSSPAIRQPLWNHSFEFQENSFSP